MSSTTPNVRKDKSTSELDGGIPVSINPRPQKTDVMSMIQARKKELDRRERVIKRNKEMFGEEIASLIDDDDASIDPSSVASSSFDGSRCETHDDSSINAIADDNDDLVLNSGSDGIENEENYDHFSPEIIMTPEGLERTVNRTKIVQNEDDDDEYPNFNEFIFYVAADITQLNDRRLQVAIVLLERENFRRRSPNIRDLITSVLRPKDNDGQKYVVGDWVEILSSNQVWSLEMVTKVFKEVKSDGKVTFYYDIGRRTHLSPYEIRVPEEGLIRLFGYRPFLWQQWALLKVEEKIRFHKNHPNDFEVFNIPEYARYLWFRWLGNANNLDFRKHLQDSRVSSSEDDLFDYMMKPFYILDDIRRENEWDFDSDNFSVFTYFSLLGSGILFPTITIILQITIPSIIVYHTLQEANWYELAETPIQYLEQMFCVIDEIAFCMSLKLTTFIVICIQVLYITKVMPDTGYIFAEVIGIGGHGPEKTYARCQSIRARVLRNNSDRFGQTVGYILDRYMNTTYTYLLFAVNLFNILNQASPTEVILNALALEFVDRIDEYYSSADWWDPGRRWLKAGTMEVFIQSIFEFQSLQNSQRFSAKYKIDEEIINRSCDGDSSLLRNPHVALECQGDLKFMSNDEIFDYYSSKYARQKARELGYSGGAIFEFSKPSVVFGSVDHCIYNLYSLVFKNSDLKSGDHFGVFKRLREYHTWSRWDKVLFLADIPELDDLFEKNKFGNSVVKKKFEVDKFSEDGCKFKNFREKPRNAASLFAKRRKDVLWFKCLRRDVRSALYRGDFCRAIGFIVYGIQEWISFALQSIFPWYNLFLMAFAVYCYNWNIIGTLERADDGHYRCDCKVFGEGFVRGGGFTCNGAYTFSIYSFGEPIINQSGDGFRNPYFDCELINNAIESDGYNITHTVMNIQRTTAVIRDDLGITQADEDEACSNWEYSDL